MPANPVRLPLRLGDTRKYIYGADLFDALILASGADAAARLRLLSISDKALELCFGEPDLKSPDLCGFFEYTRQGSHQAGWIRQCPDDAVCERDPLLDREAIEAAEFAPNRAQVERDPRFSAGKTGLILVVALLERLFPDDAWNLAEMSAVDAPSSGRVIDVKLTRQMGKFVFVSIGADGKPWGQLVLASTPYIEDYET